MTVSPRCRVATDQLRYSSGMATSLRRNTHSDLEFLTLVKKFSLRPTEILLSELRNTVTFNRRIKYKLLQPIRWSPPPFDLPEIMKVTTDFLTISIQPYMNGAF